MSGRSAIRNALDAPGYAEAATSALYLAINRDLRRAALFLWMTSLSATRSSTLIASRVAAPANSTSPLAMATSAFFTNVRAAVRCGLLRSRFFSATRIRFFDDFEFAKFHNPRFKPHAPVKSECIRDTQSYQNRPPNSR